MQIVIEIPGTQLAAINKKIALEKLAKNFNAENLMKMAELSEIPNPDEQIKALFNNAFFKMAIKR